MDDILGNPLVSVVIATFNMGPYIVGAVESVLRQTYGNIEVHVVDDGSTDSTAEEMRQFASDPRVTYQRQANAGQASAKNRGIAASRGEFVAFCDADDLWLPNKLELQLPAFARPEVGLAYTRAVDLRGTPSIEPGFYDTELAENAPRPQGHVTEALFVNNFVPFGTAMVRRECFDKVGVFDERYRMGIDWELWLRISLHYEFAFVDAVTYLYRVWEGQMSNNWRGRYEYCFRIMRDFMARYPDSVSEREVAHAWAVAYASRARIRSYRANEHVAALGDVIRCLRFKPAYFPAWRLFGRVALNALGSRAP